MASLVLSTAGSIIGSGFEGFSLFGTAISGAQIGGAIGTMAGMAIDAALMPAVKRAGPRLSDTNLQTSTEGAPIPRLFGRVRIAGQVIWATRFKETATTEGGKGMGSSVETTTYAYSISFAVGLCEGPITRLGRIWADGNLIDPSRFTLRVHAGSQTQAPDPLIEEVEGAGNTPAYRGLAYVVCEDMPLAQFGNRIPQLQFEVVRVLDNADPDALENRLTAVALIPGAGEFVCAPEIVSEDDHQGRTAPLNAHNAAGSSDFAASLDELQALAPNLASVTLVVGWFGDDLRCGSCTIRPEVEQSVRFTYPETWSVAGVARSAARLVSRVDDRPAYGGTPSDDSVKAAIADLKARGLRVTFHPFLFMDIPAGNTLPDPYTNQSGQPAYPWRGRIAISPAPGVAGSVDGTAAATTQVDAFFDGTWGWRRMVLHYAQLCAEVGGVDAFLIGSELVALTRARSDAGYPAVAQLKQLAADVHALLPAAKIGYAADWSEYANHNTGNGGVCFNLDPLWADPDVDFVGIDNYLPLADWRDGDAHRDAAEFASTYDIDYLQSNICGGEDYDWYYASPADRQAQTRTAIIDGLGKPWVWRAKDIWNWWANPHHDRTDGIESPVPTAWVPQSKPIRFTELGCPAVDKAANQPNVFRDPKSSESALPYFSNGQRDDLMQRRFLEAHLAWWSDPANNPVSGVYGAPMLDMAETSVWCWDARPFPFFPSRGDVWGDAGNYATGHWLNGRLGAVPLAQIAAALCGDAAFTGYDVSSLSGLVTGFAVTDTMSVRDALGPLMGAFFFDGIESQGAIRFVMRGAANPVGIGESDLVLPEEGFGFSLERAQETDLPNVSRVAYLDGADYRQGVVESRRLVGLSERVATSALPLVLSRAEAAGIGDRLLQDAWVMRERAQFALPPSLLALDPADEILLAAGGRTRRLRITSIDDAGARQIEAVATEPSVYRTLLGPDRAAAVETLRQPGRALVEFLDVPLLSETQNPNAPLVAAYSDPWPGNVQVFMNESLNTTLNCAASMGETTADFWSGPRDRWDRVNTLNLKLYSGTLASADDAAVFAGANALALRNGDGEWEILQFAQAELAAPNEWHLSKLLRGRRGSEGAMRDPLPAGARVVVLDAALGQLCLSLAEARLPHTYIYGPAGLPLSDAAFQSTTVAFTAAGLMPPAPCHVRHAWNAGGDLTISWLRRDRAPAADHLSLAETPLSETALSFDLEILKDGAAIRTFTAVSQHAQIYTAAEQAADFPQGLPNPLVVNLYQRSSVLGRGRRKTRALYIR